MVRAKGGARMGEKVVSVIERVMGEKEDVVRLTQSNFRKTKEVRWMKAAAWRTRVCTLTILIFIAGVLAASVIGSTPSWAQQTGNKELPLVWVLATGGTIAGKGASAESLTDYKVGSTLGSELIEAVPEIKQYANVKVEQVCNIGSQDIRVEIWAKLANRINSIFTEDPKVSGVVITHGTATLEETAYFLNLTVKHDRPVVLVGAQRPATAISADGPLNLLNAIRTAAASEARGKGVLVVMNDEISCARDVTKTNTYRVETFRSPELGFLGYVDSDKVSFYRAFNEAAHRKFRV